MTGANSMTLNKATMLEAMNLWLASEFKNPPKAIDVTEVGNAHSFTLSLTDAGKEDTKQSE